MIHVDAAQHDSEIEICLGEVMELELFENPTAGYGWRLVSNGAPELEIEGDKFEVPPAGVYGTGGVHHWHFRGAKTGTALLSLKYARSWDPQSKDSFKLKVRVKSP